MDKLPDKIKVIRPNRTKRSWYDNRIGEVFPVEGFNDETNHFQVDTVRLYDKGEITFKYGLVYKDDAEAV